MPSELRWHGCSTKLAKENGILRKPRMDCGNYMLVWFLHRNMQDGWKCIAFPD